MEIPIEVTVVGRTSQEIDTAVYRFVVWIINDIIGSHSIENAELYQGRKYMMSYTPREGWYWKDKPKGGVLP